MTALDDAPGTSQFLSGLFAPVHDELDVHDLPVTGTIPPQLRGVYMRNGANPQFAPLGRYHWFDGDGMVHAVYLDGGRARYKNRWVETPALRHERAAGQSLFGGLLNIQFPPAELLAECGVLKNAANTNIIRHAGKFLGLWEGGWPCEITRELDTVGLHDYDGRLAGAMTAHPKWCPETGELMFFGYAPFGGPPHLRYHVADRHGQLVHSTVIDLPRAVMMHDFLTTRHHSLVFDLPATFDMTGEGMWQPRHGARIGVLPRHGDGADIRWFEIDPCFVFHFLNAWEDDGTIVAYGGRMPGIDLVAGTCREELIDDHPQAFPRLHDDLLGLRHRYGYAATTTDGTDALYSDALIRFDLDTETTLVVPFGAGTVLGEPVFAPDPDGSWETDGWIMVYATDRATERTDLCILDARDLSAGPVARIHLPRRVPAGFHGNWMAD